MCVFGVLIPPRIRRKIEMAFGARERTFLRVSGGAAEEGGRASELAITKVHANGFSQIGRAHV